MMKKIFLCSLSMYAPGKQAIARSTFVGDSVVQQVTKMPLSQIPFLLKVADFANRNEKDEYNFAHVNNNWRECQFNHRQKHLHDRFNKETNQLIDLALRLKEEKPMEEEKVSDNRIKCMPGHMRIYWSTVSLLKLGLDWFKEEKEDLNATFTDWTIAKLRKDLKALKHAEMVRDLSQEEQKTKQKLEVIIAQIEQTEFIRLGPIFVKEVINNIIDTLIVDKAGVYIALFQDGIFAEQLAKKPIKTLIVENITQITQVSLDSLFWMLLAQTDDMTKSMSLSSGVWRKTLKHLRLHNLPNVEFFSATDMALESLKTIEFTDMPKLKEFPERAFEYCKHLKELDLSELSGLKKVGSVFCGGCANLTRVLLPAEIEVFGGVMQLIGGMKVNPNIFGLASRDMPNLKIYTSGEQTKKALLEGMVPEDKIVMVSEEELAKLSAEIKENNKKALNS